MAEKTEKTAMPLGAKSRTERVDGVPCSINYISALVTLGTGLVSKTERPIGWRFKGNIKTAPLAEVERQVRASPGFAALAARAAGGAALAAPTTPGASQAPGAASSSGLYMTSSLFRDTARIWSSWQNHIE